MRKREFIKIWDAYSEAVAQQDVEAMVSFLAPDAVFAEPRNPPYVGKAAIREYFARSASRPMEFRFVWHKVLVKGLSAAIEFTFSFTRRETGQTYRARGVMIVETRDGLITSIREYFDPSQLTRPSLD